MTDSTRTLETLELVGGALCLDFVNTVNSRRDTKHDYLVTYADLIGWTRKVEVLLASQHDQLQRRSKQNRQEAEDALGKAIAVRDLLYRIFTSFANESEPNKKDLESFMALYGEAITHGLLAREDDHYTTIWHLHDKLDALLWPVVHSAGGLLLSSNLQHVKECPGCGWLFLDTSKNQSRRWCSMNTCGARDKMHRYHKKQRTK